MRNFSSKSQNLIKSTECLCVYLNDYQKQCTSKCKEVLENTYSQLNLCVNHTSMNISEEEQSKFDETWSKSYLKYFPDATDYLGLSLYHYCALEGNIKLFKIGHLYLSNAIDLITVYRSTILVCACQKNQYEFVKYLLESTDASVNGNPGCAQTPLGAAISQQSYKLIELLLKHGADPSLASGSNLADQITPLKKSIIMNRMDIMYLLLKYGANPILSLMLDNKSETSSYWSILQLMSRFFSGKNFKFMFIFDKFIKSPEFYKSLKKAYFKVTNQHSSDSVFNDCYNDSLDFVFLKKLMITFYRPKSLSALCRLEIRKLCQYKDENISQLDIPSALIVFLIEI